MILIRPPHDQSRWLSELTVLFLHTAPLLLPLHPWNSPLKALACWLSGESQPLDINLPSPQIKQISFTPTLPVEYWLLNGKQLDLTFINNQKVILEPLWNHSFCSFSFFLSFFFFCTACRIFFPQPRMEPGPSAMRAQSPNNHWTTMEFPQMAISNPTLDHCLQMEMPDADQQWLSETV